MRTSAASPSMTWLPRLLVGASGLRSQPDTVAKGLPVSFRDTPLLNKPFDAQQLAAMVEWLLADDLTAHRLARKPEG